MKKRTKKAPQKAKPAKKTAKKATKSAAPKQAKGSKGKKKSAAPSIGTQSLEIQKYLDQLKGVKTADSGSDQICRETACEGLATSNGYCRLHYIKNWKKIKRRELILKEGKLNQYIEELVAKYPDKYIETIRNDLANDREFGKVVHDLELDEGIDDFDSENESLDNLIDNIRRDMDDENESY